MLLLLLLLLMMMMIRPDTIFRTNVTAMVYPRREFTCSPKLVGIRTRN
jgi:hypothetical protein